MATILRVEHTNGYAYVRQVQPEDTDIVLWQAKDESPAPSFETRSFPNMPDAKDYVLKNITLLG